MDWKLISLIHRRVLGLCTAGENSAQPFPLSYSASRTADFSLKWVYYFKGAIKTNFGSICVLRKCVQLLRCQLISATAAADSLGVQSQQWACSVCRKCNASPTQLGLMASAYFKKLVLISPVSFNIHFTIFFFCLKDLSMDGGSGSLELIRTNSTANSPSETIRLGIVLLGDILNVKLYHGFLNNVSLSAVIFIQLE